MKYQFARKNGPRTALLACLLVAGCLMATASVAGGGNPIRGVSRLLSDPDVGLVALKSDLLEIRDRLAPQQVTRSSGAFGLPVGAVAVDWQVINNSDEKQVVMVTVYELPVGHEKIVLAPGPLTFTLPPGHSTHNANSVGWGEVFEPGAAFEVVVKSHPDVVPSVSIWRSNGNQPIPGTQIPPGAWAQLQ